MSRRTFTSFYWEKCQDAKTFTERLFVHRYNKYFNVAMNLKQIVSIEDIDQYFRIEDDDTGYIMVKKSGKVDDNKFDVSDIKNSCQRAIYFQKIFTKKD